jgi:hypothetical protein
LGRGTRQQSARAPQMLLLPAAEPPGQLQPLGAYLGEVFGERGLPRAVSRNWLSAAVSALTSALQMGRVSVSSSS